MLQIRQATIDDVPVLLRLMEVYWAFEGISGFDPPRVSEQLTRLFSEPRLGCGWVAFMDGPAGRLSSRRLCVQPRTPRLDRGDRRVHGVGPTSGSRCWVRLARDRGNHVQLGGLHEGLAPTVAAQRCGSSPSTIARDIRNDRGTSFLTKRCWMANQPLRHRYFPSQRQLLRHARFLRPARKKDKEN